jgi:cytochrome c oxidase assembly factor CtaG
VGEWTIDPLQLAPLAVAVVAYAVRARTLARRGDPVPRFRIVLFALGIALILVALVSPIAALGEERFWTHMTQHLLLGDLAPLAILAGLTGPLLRPILALPPVRALRVLVHPLVALPIWLANLYVWHLPFAYEAAISNDVVHALEHVSFFTAGVLMWAPVLEILPAPVWFGSAAKLGYIVFVRLATTVLGNVFLWAGEPLYDPYSAAGRGLSPEADQALAGAIMTIEGSLVTFAALAYFFLRLGDESELRQQLIERGHDPRAVNRAVRFGRADELS